MLQASGDFDGLTLAGVGPLAVLSPCRGFHFLRFDGIDSKTANLHCRAKAGSVSKDR